MDELKPHQLEAVAKLDSGKILVGDVGTGKSWVAMEYYMQKEAPRDIFIITTAKKRDSLDWVGEAARYGIGRSQDATVAGVLTVDSWNNIGNYTSVKDAFFIFDEQRLVGSGAWTKAFIHIAKSNRWILLSATPGDTWLDYIPVFVANRFYRNRTHFKREHVVYNTFTKFPKVDHYIGVNKLVKLRNHLLVEMPMERHTTRNTEIVNVAYDRDLFEKVMVKRWHVYENRPLRDVAELFSVMRKVVNSDASRIHMVTELMKAHPKLIVFYNFDYELEILRTLATSRDATDSYPSVCSEPITTSKSIETNPFSKNTILRSSSKLGENEKSENKSKLSGGMETGIPSRKQSGLLSETSLLRSSSAGTKKLSSEKDEPTQRPVGTTSYDREVAPKRSVSAAMHESTQKFSPRSTTSTTKNTTSGSTLQSQRENECQTPPSPRTTRLSFVKQNSPTRSYKKTGTTSTLESGMDHRQSRVFPGQNADAQVASLDATEEESECTDALYDPKRGSTSALVDSESSFSPSQPTNLDAQDAAITIAEWNGHKHQPIPETDRWVYLVQYTAGSEGWNCVETNAMCFYSLTYSYKQFHQAHGRIDRMNTLFTQLYYYILRSNSAIDKAVWTSISAKKSFNESAWRKKLEKRAV